MERAMSSLKVLAGRHAAVCWQVCCCWRTGAVTRRESTVPASTDTEILIGQTNPYSGPLSSYGTQGRAQAAYYGMINEQGG